ncbi:DUF4974 domain-containing protein [Pedobacter hiemivivus]|uniref:DUF4974 domain-containing protein n=1 Tax=Pedobacter hiemivivus TaxID=2530454 RepID=A0A4U1GHF4_9SPHI|nr:FecR domain-containing protein [Pedobacter hiemivivus]TKC62370.1 DUF4974 domain-containing protein [Pedobacter hiemivivus]
MKDTNKIWILMGKKLSGSITSEEEIEMESLLSEDPELWYTYELLLAVISLDDVPPEFIREIESLFIKEVDHQKLQNLLLEELGPSPNDDNIENHRSRKKKYWLVASGSFFTALLLWLVFPFITSYYTVPQPQVVAMHEIIAPKGIKVQVTLADKTQILLNSGSKLIYPKNFSMESREVSLIGEAFFKVTHNAEHSFVVHTAEADIKDLGTTFNVKAYKGSVTTETTLIEGSVEVVLKNNPSQKILMRPREKFILYNQQAVVNNNSEKEQSSPIFEVHKIMPFSTTDDIVETAWVNDKLIFRSQQLGELTKEMERRYNVTIIVMDEVVRNYRVTGIFKNENIDEALKLLQVIAPFKFIRNNEKIIISR